MASFAKNSPKKTDISIETAKIVAQNTNSVANTDQKTQKSDKFTPKQREIIDSRGKNLIVSAAAGSGKTTVMIERITELIIKEHTPIDNFLVVTFTKASAADMKSRLIKKLSEQQPSAFILEQIDNVGTANVSNLHSFCARLLKSYFYEAGLDPTFVVLGDVDCENLKQKALDKLFDQMLEEKNEEFFELADCLQKNRSDKALKENILKLYEFFNVIFDRDVWFDNCIKSCYNSNLSLNRAANIINSYVSTRVQKLQKEVLNQIEKYNDLGLADLVCYLQDMQSTLMAIRESNGFAKNAEIVGNMPSFGAPPKVDEAMAEPRAQLDAFRKDINAEIENYKANFINPSPKDTAAELEVAKRLAISLYNATNRFGQIFAALKAEKCALDYNDLEQNTLKVLQNDDILSTLKQKYKYVFVDEYQDINAIQEKIISLLSGEDNRFMVGDVKQSIYRFRLCDPDIFLEKYSQYKTQKNSESKDLSKNFRSHAKILEFVNLIFSGRMTEDFGGVNYQKDARLVPGSDFQQAEPVTLCYIDTANLSQNQKLLGQVEIGQVYSVKEHQQADELENLKSRAEAEYIAGEIMDLVANKTIFDAKLKIDRSIRFRDIAILVPARNEYLVNLIDVLSSYNIPTSTDATVNVLEDEYIKCIYNYLKLIYNYKQDIELFSVLYSPIGNFSLKELSNLRIYEPDCRFFYQCLQNFDKISQFDANLAQKVQNFVQNLEKYRFLAGYKNIKHVARQIVADFDITCLMLTEPDGGQRVNLLEKFIDSLPESNIYKYFSEPTAELEVEKTADSNAVQVVTIHKSKGLEYPVVFLANTSRKFNMKSFYSDTIISKQLGLGINYFDQEGRIKKASLAKEAIKLTETRKSIEEQQRLLYVALTRAINKLYVVASKDFSKIKGYFPERQSSFSDWFNEFVQKDLSCEADYDFLIKTFDAEVLIGAATKPPKEQILFSDKPSALSSLMQDVASKKYLYEEATKMPQKTSVTEIASGYHESEEVYQRYNKKSSERSTSSTDKGNAYHKLMQYIDFDCKNAQDLDACINRLICQGKLTETDEKYIDKKQILALLNNSAFNQILASGQILREKEFFMNIGQNDIQIVQGVIDLMVLGNDGAVVLDYKTGNFDRPESLVKYRAQLNLYAEAVQKCYGTKVKSKGIVAIEQSKILFLD